MIESRGSRSDGPIIEQVTEQNRAEKARKLGEVQAKQILPDFRIQLGNLLAEKITPPEVITKKFTSWKEAFYRDDYDEWGDPRKKIDTKLTATIPLEVGQMSVVISASAYPNMENPDSVQGIDYEIDVKQLDHLLIIEESSVILRSKQRLSKPVDMHTVIGSLIYSRPEWERKATAVDLQKYQALLESIKQEGVTIEGSTPNIINKDFSELQAQAKLGERPMPPLGKIAKYKK